MSSWLARRTAWLAAGQLVVRGAPLVAVLVLVRSLPGPAWDQLALLLSIYLAAQTVGTLNLQHGVIFFAARLPRRELRGLIVQTETLLFITGAIAAVCVLAASFAAPSVSRWLPPLALAILLESPCACAPQALLAVERVTAAAIWEGGFAAAQLAAIVVPVALGTGVDGAVLGLVGVAIARAVGFALLVASAFPPGEHTRRRETKLMKPLAIYALPLGLALAAGGLNQSVDKWLVAALDPHAFGSYAATAQELPLLAVIPYAMGAALATRLTAAFERRDLAAARAWWLVQTASMTIVIVPVVVGIVLCADGLVELLFTSAHDDGTLAFQLFAIVGLHRVAEYGLVLRAAGRGRDLLAASALLLGANLALGAALTALVGAPGAAAGTLAANAIAWLFVLTRIARACGATLRTIFPWTLWLRTLVASGVLALIVAQLTTDGAARAAIYVTSWLVVARLSRLRARLPAVPAP
jgi:O-antigen/teichoic acid export membrane protein